MPEAERAGGSSSATTAPAKERFSEFVVRVLDQLSLSAWLPGALLVGSGAILLELHSRADLSVIDAIVKLTWSPLGVLVTVVFALVLATLITQAFEFTAIRYLEGYWPYAFSRLGITGACIRYQDWRRQRAENHFHKRREAAVDFAYIALLKECDPTPENVLLASLTRKRALEEVYDDPGSEVMRRLDAIKWEQRATPQRMEAMAAAQRKLEQYPDRSRLMPTCFGNLLRKGEDGLMNVGRQPLRTFVIGELVDDDA